MPETRDLAYKDRFVRYLIQTLSDRFDELTTFQDLPFVDQTSRVPLVYRVNQTEFTQILSAIMTGGDLAFPDIAHELELIWANPNEYGVSEDFCLDYETADSSMINYYPMDPFTEPEELPDGYLMPPFWVFGDVLPEFIGDWFDDLLEDITGYLPTDVLSTIGSFPILGDWGDIVGANLPRFDITVDGKGTLELHLLSVPFGGRALITIDEIPDIVDILAGAWLESDWLVDLDRDYTSIPPESLEVMVVEYPIETTGVHTVYVTLLPVVNDSLVPLSFGGGLRQITWCPDEIPDEPCEDTTIPEIISDDTYFENEYVPKVFGEFYSQTAAQTAAQSAIYDDTPQSVAPDVPTSAPDAIEKNALCYAVNRFVELYASQKLCLIQSQNWLESFLSDLAEAANDFYDAASLMLPFYNANIFSCFIDDDAAMTALQDDVAIEELACYLYDELKTAVMSQANFDAAILDAATTLTDEAQEIACLMQNDSNEDIFIAFLLGYNIAIERQIANEDLPCPCDTDTYWMWLFDFSIGAQGWRSSVSGNQIVSLLTGGAWVNNAAKNFASCWIQHDDLGGAYIIKACGIDYSVDGHSGNGGDSVQSYGREDISLAGTQYITDQVSFLATNGNNLIRNGYDAAEANDSQSYFVGVSNAGAPSGSNWSHINRVVLYGLPDGGGNKPAGSVWVSSVPTSPTSLFP